MFQAALQMPLSICQVYSLKEVILSQRFIKN